MDEHTATPYHLGPALFIGLALTAIFDLPALLVASVLLDVESLYVLLSNVQGYPVHGFFRSYLGASILAIMSAGIVVALGNPIRNVMGVFQLEQNSSLKKTLFSSFIGTYSHVFLDSFVVVELKPVNPSQVNPFIYFSSSYVSSDVVYGVCSLTGILGSVLY